jgi:hypothetical protein
MNDARCARCGAPFHCGVADSMPCWCAAVTLDAVVRAELAARYEGCLCGACLATAQAGQRGELTAGERDEFTAGECGEPLRLRQNDRDRCS